MEGDADQSDGYVLVSSQLQARGSGGSRSVFFCRVLRAIGILPSAV